MNGWTIDLSLWQAPASWILGAAFLCGVWTLSRYAGTGRAVRWLRSVPCAVTLTGLLALACVIEGTWGWELHRTYPFAALVLLTALALGLSVFGRLRHASVRRDAVFLLHHGGLLLVLWAGFFGAPDTVRARLAVGVGQAARVAVAEGGRLVPLPFEVRLERFDVAFYPDGTTPRQFHSSLLLNGEPAQASVNAPARYRGYTFYQQGYDPEHGDYTVLLVVRDPWLWVVYAGIALLAAGSLLLLFQPAKPLPQ